MTRSVDYEHFDAIIVGAGLSGILAAHHLQARLPHKTFAILEARDAMGGTWDLFRYPGVRSDSDMHTLGYPFRPWSGAEPLADGASILSYLRDTAVEYGIDRKVRLGHRVVAASWSSREARWTLDVKRGAFPFPVEMTCSMLLVCSGYYDYNDGYRPDFPGLDRFGGELVHPQSWPQDLVCEGKRVIVIGSGATAVTLVPALSKGGAHVTMLQRSPSYVVSSKTTSRFADRVRRRLPRQAAQILRWRSLLLGMAFYQYVRRRPVKAKARLLRRTREELGPAFDIETHFTPRYDPWDQRMCLVPDGDLFAALKSGQADIVTDEIETFTETGVRLRSGRQLDADVVVTATGLKLKLLGGIPIVVDGRQVALPETITYKGAMFSGIPNLVCAIGYSNASWTLKCELVFNWVCRLLGYMDRHAFASCVPRCDGTKAQRPMIDLASGYVRRSVDALPRQGDRGPWRVRQNYLLDLVAMRFGRVDDGVIEFGRQAKSGETADPLLTPVVSLEG